MSNREILRSLESGWNWESEIVHAQDDRGVWVGNLGFALGELHKWGSVERPAHGQYKTTAAGLNALKRCGKW